MTNGGQEINSETYAIAKADLLLKGEGEAADNIIGGPEYSPLSNDTFPSREFDFMLSNPPYGKSWKGDLERMGGKGGIRDPRFVIQPAGDAASAPESPVEPFQDVDGLHRYRTAILGVYEQGIAGGYLVGGDRFFQPEAPLPRTQFAKIVCEAFGVPVTEDMTPEFTDLGPADAGPSGADPGARHG